ncbi:serine hydrolase domain-containing protein [Nonomuraea soli]|uniref:CubicO group peptidase (Beta-lactamase class C family) n=1 Tax=Nonomuraea soli TaxID=1032476 RepID=A0A7W0CFS8_9ACTN|nr:serine hydrolase domain-containing protein [Nonomuraea soli]MBA2890355.1 CubicO group peptidase (beta-lactamase class C family) [Nonomuraea soli]
MGNAAARECERLVRRLQADERVPAVAAAVVRADRPGWEFGLNAGPHEQFRIGSVTKTFTAVLVMQLRDEGLLRLDDPLGAHLDVPSHGDLTVRDLLSHTAGLQREPYGQVWDAIDVPAGERLIAELDKAEAVLAPGDRWHYSNLAYALLGHLVAAKRGTTWERALAERLLEPLGLADTTVLPRPPFTQGYLVDAYTDAVRPEPHFDTAGLAPAAQMWSTAGDMARWALFLADPDPAVLAPQTAREMARPQAFVDWNRAWGLGISVQRQDDGRTHAGHGGAMPGFLAGVVYDAANRIGAAVLGSSSNADGVPALPHRLIAVSLEHDPVDIAPWTPGEAAPAEYASVLGPWWSEGHRFAFHWSGGRLEMRVPGMKTTVFAPEGADLLRATEGREVGERLELVRDGDGRVTGMRWATYRFTRDLLTSDENL